MGDIYEQLGLHISTLGMGSPSTEQFVAILRENLTPAEAELLLGLPTRVGPFQTAAVDEIAGKVNLPRGKLMDMLESLSGRGLLFSGKTRKGEKGYALQQVGFGFPQTFFWKGEDTPHARKMADMVARWSSPQVTEKVYVSPKTKPNRYVPVGVAVDGNTQAVYPYHTMEHILQEAKVFAVSHCVCRTMGKLLGAVCDHPTEVCLKLDDLAEYVIKRGLGREITREEALDINRKSEEAGLVHFADNAIGDQKCLCNCCGCVCWNVAPIKHRAIKRDALMATYFIRDTDEDKCIGCGDCGAICPVDALSIEGDHPAVDKDWCIGCGLCVRQCSNEAAKLRLRTDRKDDSPLPDFLKLHQRILHEKGLV